MSAARIGYSRQMARKLLKSSGVTAAPVDIEAFVREQNLEIEKIEVSDERWSGAFYSSRRTIVVNSRHGRNRQRFTIAHELGHFCLAHDVEEFTDEVGYAGSYENGAFKDDSKLADIEIEANEFASELLIPLAIIKRDYQRSWDPQALARKYEVSEAAMFISLIKHRLIKG